MQISIEIQYGESSYGTEKPPLQVYNVARILDSYMLIREGLNIMQDGNTERLRRNINELKEREQESRLPYSYYNLDNLIYYLEESARIGLYGRGFEHFNPLITLPLVEVVQFENPMELVSINNGSLKTVVKDFLKTIGEIFAKVVQEPANLPDALKNSEFGNLNRDGKAIGAVIAVSGAALLDNAYKSQGVTSVEAAIIDNEDKGMQVNFA
jgi:hypothetical protein